MFACARWKQQQFKPSATFTLHLFFFSILLFSIYEWRNYWFWWCGNFRHLSYITIFFPTHSIYFCATTAQFFCCCFSAINNQFHKKTSLTVRAEKMVKILMEASTMCIHKYAKCWRGFCLLPAFLFCLGKKSMQRLGKKERNRSFLRYISHKVITFKCYCCCFFVEISIFPSLFTTFAKPSSLCFYHSSRKRLILTFFGVSSFTLCVMFFYTFWVVVYSAHGYMASEWENKSCLAGRKRKRFTWFDLFFKQCWNANFFIKF